MCAIRTGDEKAWGNRPTSAEAEPRPSPKGLLGPGHLAEGASPPRLPPHLSCLPVPGSPGSLPRPWSRPHINKPRPAPIKSDALTRWFINEQGMRQETLAWREPRTVHVYARCREGTGRPGPRLDPICHL